MTPQGDNFKSTDVDQSFEIIKLILSLVFKIDFRFSF